jgi:hypothetical protein
MEWGTPADIVHIGREDPARSQGLADGLMPTFPAHDHLMWDARKGRDIPPELVQQERQILAWRQILLLHDVVVSREGVHFWMVVGRRFHDLRRGLTGWTHIKRRDRAYLPPHDVLALPDIVGL